MEILKKLRNVKILIATVTNISSVLVITGVIDTGVEGTIAKVAALVAATLVQLGILTTMDSTNK